MSRARDRRQQRDAQDPSIQRWLLLHPRFTPHITPTYSSWLNRVERWFAELIRKWIKRGTYRFVRELVASIRTWIEIWNEEPKPFVWHNTADRLDPRKLCRLLRQDQSMTQVTRRTGR